MLVEGMMRMMSTRTNDGLDRLEKAQRTTSESFLR